MKKYDVIVIGAGSAGLSIALPMNDFGFNVLLVDKSAHRIGSDCLNEGCVPSKALIHISREIQAARTAQLYGWTMQGECDLSKVMDYVFKRQSIIRNHENKGYLEEKGIDIELGEAHFKGKNSISIGNQVFVAKNIVIATGSKPRQLHIDGVEALPVITNEDVFNLKELPKELVVIGGGPIGVELGQAFHRLGSKVTIVHRAKRLLEKEHKDISKILHKRLKKEGIDILLNATPVSGTEKSIRIEQDGASFELRCDNVLVTIGRELNHQSLGLENAGIKTKDNEIVLNNKLQTTNKNVYVSGDAAGSLMFSHAAEFHGRIILNNFFSPFKKKLSYKHFSWVTFCDPEVATFGMSNKQLRKKGIAYEKMVVKFNEDDRAVVDDYRYGKLIVYISKKSFFKRKQCILGGSMIAPRAGELIQELVTLMVAREGLSVLFDKVYAYPVATRINQKAAARKKSEGLTSLVKKLLKLLY